MNYLQLWLYTNISPIRKAVMTYMYGDSKRFTKFYYGIFNLAGKL